VKRDARLALALRFVRDQRQSLHAKNTFIDHCRVRQRRSRFTSLDELPADFDAAFHPTHRLSEILRDALAGLPPEERELIQAA
jgi:DNA-directed RNA polymerase specialized sigma24 family protein